MNEVRFYPCYHEWNLSVNNEIIYTTEDFTEGMPDPVTLEWCEGMAEQIVELMTEADCTYSCDTDEIKSVVAESILVYYRDGISVEQLTRNELSELKGNYLIQLVNEGTFSEVTGLPYDAPSGADMADPDDLISDDLISDDLIYDHYSGISFSHDDFFCAA